MNESIINRINVLRIAMIIIAERLNVNNRLNNANCRDKSILLSITFKRNTLKNNIYVPDKSPILFFFKRNHNRKPVNGERRFNISVLNSVPRVRTVTD